MTTYQNLINFPYTGYKNLIVNGAMQIWQRGTSFTLAASGYTADRWYGAIGNASSYTYSRQALGSSGFQYLMRVQRINGQTDTHTTTLCYAFETVDSIPAQGQTVTLSFYARCGANFSSGFSLLNFNIFTGTGTDQSMASMVSSTWTGFASVGNSVTLTTTLTRFSFVTTLGASITQLGLLFGTTPVGTAGAADYWEITGVMLEIGDTTNGDPTAYENRPFSYELEQSQRWYSKSFLYGTAPAQSAGTGTGEQIYPVAIAGASVNSGPMIHFPQLMRVAPTLTIYNPSAANAQIRNESTPADCSSTTTSFIADRGFVQFCTGNAGATVDQILGFHWQAEASL